EWDTVLDAGSPIGNLCEILAPQLLLFLHTEWTVVCGDDLKVIHFQTLPQFRLVRFVPKRRRHYILRPIKSRLVVVVERKEKILGASFCKSRYATVACLANLVQRVGTR